VTLTDSSATGAAAYLNVRKKDGIIKKGEKRACADWQACREQVRPAGRRGLIQPSADRAGTNGLRLFYVTNERPRNVDQLPTV